MLIAIPAMDTVKTDFMLSLLALRKPEGSHIAVMQNSLVHTARNHLVWEAISGGNDYILWIDSDMVFQPDLAERLLKDAEQGMDYVSALCFRRQLPTGPTVYKSIVWDGLNHDAVEYSDYPKDTLFECGGTGMAAVLTKTEIYKTVMDKFEIAPFEPLPRLGEDFSLCYRLKECGIRMYCDSRIKVGHIGNLIYNEDIYKVCGTGNF